MQMNLPTITKINKLLIIVTAGIFLVDSILMKTAGFSLRSFTALSGPSFFSGHIYQLITYPFVGGGFFEVLFTGMIFWFLGSDLENIWGPKRYLSFIATTLIGGGLAFLLIGLLLGSPFPFTGMHGLSGALCICFGILFPDRMMILLIFPVKARYFVMLLIGMSLWQGFFAGSGGVQAWGQLGAYASGVAWMFIISSPRFKSFISKSERKKPPRKSHLSIVKDKKDDKDDITYH